MVLRRNWSKQLNKQELLQVAQWLRKADEDGIYQIQDAYAVDDRYMCALSAIYFEATDGTAPTWWWKAESDTVLKEISEKTGIGFGDTPPEWNFSLMGGIIHMNDSEDVSFLGIAEALEETVL